MFVDGFQLTVKKLDFT